MAGSIIFFGILLPVLLGPLMRLTDLFLALPLLLVITMLFRDT